jgi:hypothetical protein
MTIANRRGEAWQPNNDRQPPAAEPASRMTIANRPRPRAPVEHFPPASPGSERVSRPASLASGAAAVLVILAAVLPYLPSISDWFLGDDFGLVWLFANKPTFHVLSIITSPWTESIYGIRPDELRPTLGLSYQFDSLWGANNPVGYHASNVAFHVVSSLLVFAIAWRIVRLALPAAVFAAALFAVLPPQAETVVWISGRADSIPAMFYLATFFGFAAWRRTANRGLYALAIVTFVLALFSKQSAITMPIMLVAFDMLVGRRRPALTWAWLRPYLPFVALTVGYLLLRVILFGNAVREQTLTAPVIMEFAIRQATYVKMLLVGSSRIGMAVLAPEIELLGRYLVWLLIGVAMVAVLLEVRRVWRGQPGAVRGRLIFFGIVWWLVCIVPLVVTYESPRHLYLPSVGVAIVIAMAFGKAWRGDIARRVMSVLVAAVLVVGSARLMDRAAAAWHGAAEVSAQVTRDLERELAMAPTGSLVVVDAPLIGASSRYHTWLWMWSMPFGARAPFVEPGLESRVNLVSAPDVYCCPRDQWHASTLQSVASWASRADRPPAIILQWQAWNGALSRKTEADTPGLHAQLEALVATSTPRELCDQLDALLGDISPSCEST